MDLLTTAGYRLNVVSKLSFGYWMWKDGKLLSDWNLNTVRNSLGSTADSIVYVQDGSGGYEELSKYKDEGKAAIDTVVVFKRNGVHQIKDDYADIAFNTGGAAWNLDMRRKGGDSELSLTKAFAKQKVEEMVDDAKIVCGGLWDINIDIDVET